MTILNLKGDYATDVRPARANVDDRKAWAKDPSGPEANDGTRIDSTFVNDLLGLIRSLLNAYSVAANPGDDTALVQVLQNAVAGCLNLIGQPNGIAPLDGSGMLPVERLPAIAINDTFNASSDAAMIELVAHRGDICVRDDLNQTYILAAEPASTLSNWKLLKTPTDAVQSVGGLAGVISAASLKTALSLVAADITDSGTAGRQVLQAANVAAIKIILGFASLDGAEILSNKTLDSALMKSSSVVSDPGNDASFKINKPASGVSNNLRGQTNSVDRWLASLGTSDAESGANAGSDYALQAFDDGGTLLGDAIRIKRADRALQLFAPPVITTAKVDQDGRVYLSRVNTYKGDGSSNDQPACQVAMDAIAARAGTPGGCLVLPSGGLVRLNSAVTFTADCPISVVSEGNRRGCKIDQRGAPGAFLFTGGANSNQAIFISGLYLVANVAAAAAIGVDRPENVVMEHIRAVGGTGQWGTFFDGNQIRTSSFREMYIRNDHGLNTLADITGQMFRLNTVGVGSTSNKFYDMTLQGFQNSFNFDASGSPGNEGIHISGVEVVGCLFGVLWRHTSGGGYIPPLMNISDSHFACFGSMGLFDAVAQVSITDCTMELSSTFGHTNNAVEFGSVTGWTFRGNRVFFVNGNRAARGVLAKSGAVQGDAHQNTFNMPGGVNAIELQTGANNNKVSFNKSTGASNCVVNGGTGNDIATSNTTF